MKTGYIFISIPHAQESPFWRKTPAIIQGKWAIHRANGEEWCITYIPSGLRLPGHPETKEEALALLKLLGRTAYSPAQDVVRELAHFGTPYAALLAPRIHGTALRYEDRGAYTFCDLACLLAFDEDVELSASRSRELAPSPIYTAMYRMPEEDQWTLDGG